MKYTKEKTVEGWLAWIETCRAALSQHEFYLRNARDFGTTQEEFTKAYSEAAEAGLESWLDTGLFEGDIDILGELLIHGKIQEPEGEPMDDFEAQLIKTIFGG